VYLAGRRLEAHVVVRDDARKALRDPDDANRGRRRGAGLAGASLF